MGEISRSFSIFTATLVTGVITLVVTGCEGGISFSGEQKQIPSDVAPSPTPDISVGNSNGTTRGIRGTETSRTDGSVQAQANPTPPSDCEPGKGYAGVKQITQKYTQGPNALLQYSLSLYDCEGIQVKINEAALLFDIDAYLNSSDITIPFSIKDASGQENYTGTLVTVMGSDMFGKKGEMWSHFESAKPISFASKPRELLISLDISKMTISPRVDLAPQSSSIEISTYLTFGAAKPATATIITNRL